MNPVYLDKLPEDGSIPISHAMTEYILDLFYGPYRHLQQKSLSEMIRWIDQTVEKIQETSANRQTRPLAPRNFMTNQTLVFPEGENGDIFHEASISAFMMRTSPKESEKHVRQIRIDPKFAMTNDFEYDNAAFQLPLDEIPDAARVTIMAKIKSYADGNKKNPVMMQDIVKLSISSHDLPEMTITNIDEETSNEMPWFELDESWEPWEVQRSRLIKKHKLRIR